MLPVNDKLQAFNLRLNSSTTIDEGLLQVFPLTGLLLQQQQFLEVIINVFKKDYWQSSGHFSTKVVVLLSRSQYFPAQLGKKFLYSIRNKECQGLGIVYTRTVGINH